MLTRKLKKFSSIAVLALATFLIACSNPVEPVYPVDEQENEDALSPEDTRPVINDHLALKRDFIDKAIANFHKLPYHGYAKILKNGNFMSLIFLKEVSSFQSVDIKLHYQNIIMNIPDLENFVTDERQLPESDPEFIDLNQNKFSILFSGKCLEEYKNEIGKDIDTYAAYDYFKLTKAGYNVDIIYGGKEFDRLNNEVMDNYYKTSYRLDIDSCQKNVLSPSQKIVNPFEMVTPDAENTSNG